MSVGVVEIRVQRGSNGTNGIWDLGGNVRLRFGYALSVMLTHATSPKVRDFCKVREDGILPYN